MEITVEHDSAKGLCTLRLTGCYSGPSDTHEAQRIVASLHTQYGCRRVLIDMTQADISVSTVAVFEAGNPQSEMAAHLIELRSAFLYREITQKLRFFEDVAVNRGFQVRVFDQLDKALEWLQGG